MDVFAIGVTLFNLFAGFPAFVSANDQKGPYHFIKCGLHDQFWAHQEQLMPKGYFPKPFKQLICGMLNPDPTQRLTIE